MIDKKTSVQRRIIFVASLEFLLATMGLMQLSFANPVYEGLRYLFLVVFASTAIYGFRLVRNPALLDSESGVPMLKSPVREMLRIGASLVTLPIICYVGYGEFLILVDAQYVPSYTKRVFEYAALKKRLESETAGQCFICLAGYTQARIAERLEMTHQDPFAQYGVYIELMKAFTKNPNFGLAIMARIYDKFGETAKADELYAEDQYYYHMQIDEPPSAYTVIEARLLDVLRYIPEKEALKKISWMPKLIADKNTSALTLGLKRVSIDFRRTIYDARGLDSPIGYHEGKNYPIMLKEDVEWLLATIGKKRVMENIPVLAPLCPDWKTSDYVFEYGVIPPIAYGAQQLPDVFLNRKCENKAPLSWRVPASLASLVATEEVIMPVEMSKKLIRLAGDPYGYEHRVSEGTVYFNGEKTSYDEAKMVERTCYKKIARLGH